MTINKKLILVTATVSLGILGGVLQSDKILQSVSNTAHAFSVPSKDVTYVPSITTNNNIEVDIIVCSNTWYISNIFTWNRKGVSCIRYRL